MNIELFNKIIRAEEFFRSKKQFWKRKIMKQLSDEMKKSNFNESFSFSDDYPIHSNAIKSWQFKGEWLIWKFLSSQLTTMFRKPNDSFVEIQPVYPPLLIQSSITLVVAIVSVPCFIILLYYLLKTPTLYRALPNHVIILILIVNFVQTLIDVPVQMSYYYTGFLKPATDSFCIFYYFIDYYLFTTSFLLITWASFERHILIFHSRLYRRKINALFFHYFPLVLCLVYPFVYYFYFLVLYPCRTSYEHDQATCSIACFIHSSTVLAIYEQIAHGFAQIFFTSFFNVTLVFRVLMQKRRVGQYNARANHIKMMLQLSSICLLLILTNGGFFLIQLVRLLWNPDFGHDASAWIYPLSLCLPPSISFVCFLTLREIRLKVHRMIHRKFCVQQVPVTIRKI